MDIAKVLTKQKIASFIPGTVHSIQKYILSGSRAYNCHIDQSDYDLVGIHIIHSQECLKHPDFRGDNQVIRYKFDHNFEQINGKKSFISLDSFELWKFTTLWLKGAFISYELLYQVSPIEEKLLNNIFFLMQEGVTNRIGKAAKGQILHNWGKDKYNRKITINCYFRALQALKLLHKQIFINDARSLILNTNLAGKNIFMTFIDPELRNTQLSNKELVQVNKDFEELSDQLDKAVVFTKLPDQVPKKILENVLQETVKCRLDLLKGEINVK